MSTLKLKKTLLTILCATGLAAAAGSANAVPFYWTDWQGVDLLPGTPFQAQGTITTPTSAVTVTYTNQNGIAFYQPAGGPDYWQNGSFGAGGRNDAVSPYTSTLVDNAPTGTDIVALLNRGSQTLQFSQSVANPVFAYVSLNGNGYQFLNQDFDFLSQGGVDGNACGYWGCGTAHKTITNLSGGDVLYSLIADGGEPHGAIRFTGAFNLLTWTSLSNENWNGFTVGVQGTAREVFAPEPGTLALLGLGFAGAVFSRRNKVLV